MPMAPGDPAQAQLTQATGGPSTGNLLMAAADLSNSGQLSGSPSAPRSAPMPKGQNLQTGWLRRRYGRHGMGIRVVK